MPAVTLRLPTALAEDLESRAKKRGISVPELIRRRLAHWAKRPRCVEIEDHSSITRTFCVDNEIVNPLRVEAARLQREHGRVVHWSEVARALLE